MECKIRLAGVEDAAEMLAIYAPFVTDTAISFEYDVPSLSEFESRIKNRADYPHIVAEVAGKVVGYAYLGAFVGRAAYSHCAETTIYIAPHAQGNGIGRALYKTLERCAMAQNITTLYACIGRAQVEDEYLTNASIAFHERMGFRQVGEFVGCGRKFGRWYDMVWMEKVVSERRDDTPPFLPISKVDVRKILHETAVD